MAKIQVPAPLVELDGDEMTRVIWQLIKEELLLPYLDVPLIYFDLHLSVRDRTGDQVTRQAAEAIREHGVGVKCATITPDQQRVTEYNLQQAWPSPNATIRGMLDGTVFRCPIIPRNIPPAVRSWKKPIIVGRHAYGDIYSAVEIITRGPGVVELSFSGDDGRTEQLPVHRFAGPGMVMAMHNTEASIVSFAKACIDYAISAQTELWFCAKDTISKKYHGRFREIVEQSCARQEEELKQAGVVFKFFLIDDAAAQLMKHEGGMLLALMNYDGDVWSDLIAGGFGSLGLMTSVLVSPDGCYEFEAAHGTVRRHYQQHLQGKKTSTNPVASIFAWTGALAKRGELSGAPQAVRFAKNLEQAVLGTIESGKMTGDLARIASGGQIETLDTGSFIRAVKMELERQL